MLYYTLKVSHNLADLVSELINKWQWFKRNIIYIYDCIDSFVLFLSAELTSQIKLNLYKSLFVVSLRSNTICHEEEISPKEPAHLQSPIHQLLWSPYIIAVTSSSSHKTTFVNHEEQTTRNLCRHIAISQAPLIHWKISVHLWGDSSTSF